MAGKVARFERRAARRTVAEELATRMAALETTNQDQHDVLARNEERLANAVFEHGKRLDQVAERLDRQYLHVRDEIARWREQTTTFWARLRWLFSGG